MNELLNQSAHEMLALLRSREVSCTELVSAHIEHIQDVNQEVNAIVTECFESAIEKAKHLDSQPKLHGTLAGLPIAHKDLVSTKGIRTTHGSTLFRDNVPDTNDYIIDRMQDADAITIGKTNVPEFGAGSHTFNRVFGPTRNPYDTERTCGGSSGGAAVALASRMMPIADGSDLGGSLRNPAAFCNVIGFRPTNNKLPPKLDQDGGAFLNLSSLGPMARCIDDVWLLFNVLKRRSNTQSRAYRLRPMPLENLRIAFTKDFGGLPVEAEIKKTVENVVKLLEQAGATVEEDTIDLSTSRQIFHVIRGFGFRSRFNDLTWAELRELKPTVLWNIVAGESYGVGDVLEMHSNRDQLAYRVESFFEKYDLWIGPTTQVLPFPIAIDWPREIEGVQMDTYIDWMESCSLVTTTECPCLSLPAGFASGLPVGIQLIGPKREDKRLLRMAKAVESIVSSASVKPPLCGD